MPRDDLGSGSSGNIEGEKEGKERSTLSKVVIGACIFIILAVA